METITEITIKIFVEAILISGILGYIFSKREERMKKTIEEEFKKRDKFFDVRFNFKLRALEELLAPIKLQLIRSKITLMGYDANNEYREKILKECNQTIRGLLLEKGHLIPSDLILYAEKFISHYDEWLQAYRDNRELNNKAEVKHVFTYNFPHDAEKAFIEKYEAYRKELKIEGSLD
jgi:hypothetical protein